MLDNFGGTLTTAFSATATSRECIEIEKDKCCINKAVHELSHFVASKRKFLLKNTVETLKTLF